MARTYSRVGEAHRVLKLDARGDYQRGADVLALQVAANARLRARDMDRFQCPEDGVYGPATALACRKAIWALGAPLVNVRNVRTEHDPRFPHLEGALPEWAQLLVREPHERTYAQLSRARDRQPEILEANRRAAASSPAYTVTQRGVLVPYRTRGYGDLGEIRRVIVHHSAGPVPESLDHAVRLIRAYDAQHRQLYGGGIGYHEIHDHEGRVFPVRSSAAKGAHTSLMNAQSYGICLLGNFEEAQPPAAMLATLKARVNDAPRSGLPDLRGLPVSAHRDWGHVSRWNRTACPGRHLYPIVQAL